MATTVSRFLWFWLWFSFAQSQQLSTRPRLSSTDFDVLIDLKQSLRDLPGSDFFSSWNLSSPSAISDACSSFSGILCSPADELDGGTLRVTSLTLGSVAGNLPSSIANLSLLSQFIASPGQISGSIPTSMSSMFEIRLLSITGNLISGEIPSFSAASKLHTLDLSHNLLSGQVPGDLLNLPCLRVLILAGNGGISGKLAAIVAPLLHLDLRESNFSGPLPSPLPPSLRYLSVSRNAMTGPLDALSASFPDLAFLDISFNGFSGPIPQSLFDPRRPLEEEVPPPLTVLLLQRNKLSGPIPVPREPSAMSQWTLDLSHNQLTGNLPPELAQVESLFVNHNRLTGAVPQELVRSLYAGSMTTFYAQHNFLSAVEYPPPSGDPAVEAPLPEGVTVCMAFNCVGTLPEGPSGCPAGGEGPRPANQCSALKDGAFLWDEDEP